jgi:cytochrome oxidase Cu insertion factor (SCO1/SenC/PrrC family)
MVPSPSFKPVTIYLLLAFILPAKVAYTQSTGDLSNTPAPVVIYGEITSKQLSDTISVFVHADFLGESVFMPPPQFFSIIPDLGDGNKGLPGTLAFSFQTDPIQDFAYLHIAALENDILMDYFLALPGDSVGIKLDRIKNTLVFSGPHAERFSVQQEIMMAHQRYLFEKPAAIVVADKEKFLAKNQLTSDRAYGIRFFEPVQKETEELGYIASLLEENPFDHPGFKVIERYKGQLDHEFLQILEANLYGMIMKTGVFRFNYSKKANKENWVSLYRESIKNIPTDQYSPQTTYKAYHLTDLILEKDIAGFYAGEAHPYQKLKETADPLLRDRLVTKYLVKYFDRIAKREEYINEAITYVTDPASLGTLLQYKNNLSIGKEAFPFSLTETKGNKVTLQDLKGKVLFMDFWFTGCQACVTYFNNSLHPAELHFKDNPDILFISVSTDKSKSRWLSSVEGGKYTSPEAINLFTEEQGINHPFLQHYTIHAFPFQLLIDREGKLLKIGGMQTGPEELIGILEEAVSK